MTRTFVGLFFTVFGLAVIGYDLYKARPSLGGCGLLFVGLLGLFTN